MSLALFARPAATIGALALLALAALPSGAAAQSTEERLREVLRKTVVDMRAAQDSAAALQAQLDQAKAQRDTLQQQVDELRAQAAERPAQPPAPPPPAPVVAEDTAKLDRLRATIEALQRQNAELGAGLRKWQAAYQQAAALAQSKDSEAKQAQATLTGTQATLGVCQQKNTRMLAVANDILHLYRTSDFRSLLIGSYEPLLGLKKVELENIVQDNEDRIIAQRYHAGERPAAAAPAPAPAPAPARAPSR